MQIAGNADCQIANCQSREETDKGDHTQQYDNAYCIIYQIAIVQHILYTCANPNRGPHTLTQHATGHEGTIAAHSGKLRVGSIVGSVMYLNKEH